MAIAVITWLWGDKYCAEDVNRLARAVRKHLKQPHRFVVFTDQTLFGINSGIEIKPIADLFLRGRGCFCRLRMFDPIWQFENGFDDRIVSLDLDMVIVGQIDKLFDRPDQFAILRGANSTNPNPFNASVMMLRAGYRPDVWSEFSLARAEEVPFHEFPDDQGWIWHMIPDAEFWNVGPISGIYGFQKPGWPAYGSQRMPVDARIIAFIGKRKPAQYTNLPWVQKYWMAG